MQCLHFPESTLGMSLSVLAHLKRCVTATTLGSIFGPATLKQDNISENKSAKESESLFTKNTLNQPKL